MSTFKIYEVEDYWQILVNTYNLFVDELEVSGSVNSSGTYAQFVVNIYIDTGYPKRLPTKTQ